MIEARRGGLPAVVAAFLLLVPLAATPVLPLIDFYNHIARFFVLAHIDDNAVFAANYTAAWALLPNLGLDVIGTPLMEVVPPLIGAKLLIGLILLVQFGGVLFLHRALHGGRQLLPVLILPGLLYSYILTWGFANFLLGLGLAFWNLGLWLRLRNRPPLATALCALGALAIFMCHAFSFAVYGILIAGLELGRWLAAGNRRPSSLLFPFGALAAQAVVPVLFFLNMPTSAATGKSGSLVNAIGAHAGGGSLEARLDFEFWYRLRTIVRVAESPYWLLDIITITTALILIGVALWKGWFKLHRWAWPALVLAALLCLFVPPSLFGSGYVSDRMPLVFALMLVAALGIVQPLTSGGRTILAAFALVSLVRLAAVFIGWSAYDRHYADFRRALSVVPPGALVTDLLPTGGDLRDGLLPRCQMYRPLTVVLNGDVTSLFASPSQQPIRLAGPLAAASRSTVDAPDMRLRPRPGYYDEALAGMAGSSRFDYVLMCGRDRLTRPLPPGVTIAAQQGGISVLKLH